MFLRIDVQRFDDLMLERYCQFDSIEYIVINCKRNQMLNDYHRHFKVFNKETNLSHVVIVVLNARVMYLNNDFLKKKVISNKSCELIIRINENNLF